jgi:anti-sigma regulatory factor (Ser/Thr protein kinase)
MNVVFNLNPVLAELETLGTAVGALQDELNCTDRQMCEISLLIEELCANIIAHGAEKGAGRIMVCLEKDWDELCITVEDDGPPFDPTGAPEVDICLPLEKRCPGGLGIHLIRHYADSLDYCRENDKNRVTLRKTL